MKKMLYLRNGPYIPQINSYNMQEIGFCKALSNNGWNCEILYYSNKNKDEVIYCNKKNNTTIKILWRKGLKILRTGIYPSLFLNGKLNRYQLIITTEYSQIMSLLISFFSSKVVLYTGPYYNLFKIPALSFIYDLLFTKIINTKMKHIFCKSKLAADYLQKKGYSKISVLGVGLDTSIYENIEILESTKPIQIILQKFNCLLYVGSIDDRKNFSFLLKVFVLLKQSYDYPDVKLVIIGKGEQKYIERNLISLSNEMKKDIFFFEKIENTQLQYIYPYAKCFLLPSKHEIFGMVLLESMYFGCIPISSQNGGSLTLIKHGENGFIVDNFDENLWVKQIKIILDNNMLRKKMSNEAIKTIKKEFLWDCLVNKFLSKYEKQV